MVVAGRPNVGKSSIFNTLAGADRAIVTPIAGTTRDLIAEQIDIDGLAITLVDTAGWRETLDPIEHEGVTRGERAREVADLLVLVLDRSEPLEVEDERLLAQTEGRRRIVVANKADLPAALDVPINEVGASGLLSVSAKTGAGADELRRAIVCELTGSESLRDTAGISNVRHITLIEQCARESRLGGTGRGRGRHTWRNSFLPICRPRAPGSRRSSALARARICCSIFSRNSALGNSSAST